MAASSSSLSLPSRDNFFKIGNNSSSSLYSKVSSTTFALPSCIFSRAFSYIDFSRIFENTSSAYQLARNC
jgi:hypothetical protein